MTVAPTFPQAPPQAAQAPQLIPAFVQAPAFPAPTVQPTNPAPQVFEKECLRVGHWACDGGDWDVTADDIRGICHNFNLSLERGNGAIPIRWEHEGGAKERIGDIFRVESRENDTVLFCVHTAEFPDDQRRLGVTNREVSVGVDWDYVDGSGNHYPIFLNHVAVCDNTVIPNQSNFKRILSNLGGDAVAIFTGKRSRKTRRLQADEIAGLPFADLLDGINMLIKVGDPMSVLPDDTTEENFDDRFTLVIARFKMMAGENTPDDEPAELPDIVDGADILETAGAEFKSATPEQRRQLQTQLGRLKELEAAEAERLREDELKFTQFIDHKLIATGRVPVTQRDSLLLQGKQARFSLTAVQLLESIPEGTHVDATGKSKVRKLSVPSPPGLPGKETAETDEEMGNRALKLFGHDPKN